MTLERVQIIIESMLSHSVYDDWEISFQLGSPIGGIEIGRIWGHIYFFEGSTLTAREVWEGDERNIFLKTYAYHFTKEGKFFFRYDNKKEKRYRRLKTYPHHLHIWDENYIVQSDIPDITLKKVLEKIFAVFQSSFGDGKELL